MGRRTSRVLLVLAVAVSLVTVLVLPVNAQGSITIDPKSGMVGDTIEVTGSNFAPNKTVTIFLDVISSNGILTSSSTNKGLFVVDFEIPAGTSPGNHIVYACEYSAEYDTCILDNTPPPSADLIVESPPTTTSAPPPTTTTVPPPTTTTAPRDSTTTLPPIGTTSSTLPIGVPSSTTTSSLALGSVTTTTSPDPPAASGPMGVAFTTTSTSLDLPSGFTDGGDDYFPDIEITAVEVTQGIQDLQNRMPLVAHKQTVVRVYVAVDKIVNEGLDGLVGGEPEQTIGPEGWDPIDGLLHLQRGGQDHFVYPLNAPITGYRTGSDRLEQDHTLNFVLPDEWLHGDVQITALVWSFLPENIFDKESDALNNFAQGTVTFHNSESPITVWFRLDTATSSLSDSEYEEALGTATESYVAFHPIDVPNFVPVWPELGPGEIFGDNPPPEEWDLSANRSAPLDRLYWLWVTWGTTDPVRFHGLVDFNTSTDGAGGLTSSGMKVAWSKPNHTTPAHEGAHMYGIRHAPCQDEDQDGIPDEVDGGGWGWIDQTYPSGAPSCSIAPEDPAGYYGISVRDDHFGWRMSIFSNSEELPNTIYPLMGYRRPKGVDAYHYCLLMETYGIPCDPASIGLTPKSPPGPPVNCGPAQGDGFILDLCLWDGAPDVNLQLGEIGSIQWAVPEDPPDGWLVIEVDTQNGVLGHGMVVEPSQHLETQFEFIKERAKRGGYANNIRLMKSKAGHTLLSIPVSTAFAAHNEVGDGAKSIEILPWYDDGISIDLVIDGEIVDSRAPTAPPTVTIDPIEPPTDRSVTVSWNASDPDGDDLLYTLLWSVDGGESWQTVDTGFSSPRTTLTVEHGLPGGEVWVKVIASDGLMTRSEVAGPVTIPKGTPFGVVVAPDHIARYTPQRMTFHIIDPEDGPIETGFWASSLDGDLGEGRTMWTRDLRLGSHEISVTAADSDGNQVTVTKIVEVVDGGMAAPRLPGDVAEAELIAKAGPNGWQELIDQRNPPGSLATPSQVAVIVIGGAVAVLIGGLIFRSRRRT